ncbi:MAG: branched-chain amino acid ABC transporter permease [Candidatus Dormibacteraeota bacterium]|nr:branched-chain amino acid ABC transporter permease [Candidatus Dormibacteraeota bacterium]MBO0760174.1 branched-chain amino acid ABC transporter permease [Candidatus Dormibacteraeota bacterium]
MPDLRPYIVLGIALGSVFAVSGVGMVVLYRATGVLNLAYGAVGALGSLVAWSMINVFLLPDWLAYIVAVLLGGVASLLYGLLFGPPLAQRDPLVKAVATLGFLLILLGIMSWVWTDKAHALILPTTEWGFSIGTAEVTVTQVLGLALAVVVTALATVFLRVTKLGTAMRALANDREITAMQGVPVRRVEAAAWFGSGLLSGATGLLLSTLVGLDAVTLTFLVIAALSAALVGRLQSLWITLAAGLVIGVIQSVLTPFNAISPYRAATPFVVAIIVLLWFARRRPQVVR